jgi:hypothetical protein
MDMPALLASFAWAREVAATVEAGRVTAVRATETFAQEATAACDSAALHVKGVEYWAALA